jgi:hypothetical protein
MHTGDPNPSLADDGGWTAGTPVQPAELIHDAHDYYQPHDIMLGAPVSA